MTLVIQIDLCLENKTPHKIQIDTCMDIQYYFRVTG